MTVGAFDEIIRKPDEFSERIARNQQIILQEECNLADVIDPAGGSYYVENLTRELAAKIWVSEEQLFGTRRRPFAKAGSNDGN